MWINVYVRACNDSPLCGFRGTLTTHNTRTQKFVKVARSWSYAQQLQNCMSATPNAKSFWLTRGLIASSANNNCFIAQDRQCKFTYICVRATIPPFVGCRSTWQRNNMQTLKFVSVGRCLLEPCSTASKFCIKQYLFSSTRQFQVLINSEASRHGFRDLL